LVNLATLLAFWKKRESPPTPEPKRIIPLPNLGSSTLEAPPATSLEAVGRAREALKLLKLERQIVGSAVATIYESHTQGVISEAERDRMLEKYKADLKRLEQVLEDNQRTVDLYDLEIERNELIKSFNAKLAEIDARLKELKSGAPLRPRTPTPKPEQSQPRSSSSSEGSRQANQESRSKDKEDDKESQQAIADSEKRIEQIREEILKAMDRLEQIEGEG
jgi:hypothetical protein